MPRETNNSQTSENSINNRDDLIGWLAFRQTNQLYEFDEDSDYESESETGHTQTTSPVNSPPTDRLSTLALSLDDTISSLPTLQEVSQLQQDQFSCAGFNGRLNKTADTCYCFWVTGSLAVLPYALSDSFCVKC